MKTDIEIAQQTPLAPITEIAEKAGVDAKYVEQYGKYKAKIGNFYFSSNCQKIHITIRLF